MRPLWPALTVGLLLVGVALAGGDDKKEAKPPPLRERLKKAMQTVRGFRADFEQEKKLRVFKKPVKSSGILLFERPDRMRWEIRKPFRSLLVVNGSKVAKFEWVDGKRRAIKLGRGADALLVAMNRLRAWFTGEFNDKTFTIEVQEKPEIRLVLRPKAKALKARIDRLEFYPSKDLKSMRRVVIVEAKGDVTVMRFKNHTTNQPAPKSAFSTKDPAKIDG